jgi:hypothetical protein
MLRLATNTSTTRSKLAATRRKSTSYQFSLSTKRLIVNYFRVPLFEAAFEYAGALLRADILVPIDLILGSASVCIGDWKLF